MVSESQKWGSGERLVCEDVEGKNINKAEDYIKQNHPEVIGQKLQNGTVITPRILTQEIRNSFKNVRGPQVTNPNTGKTKDTCKFLLGVTRIYFEDLKEDQANFQRKCQQLDSYLGIIVSAHADEYDQNLNGLGFDELKTRFESAAKQSITKDKEEVSKETYTKNDEYEIIPIDSFEEASKYGQYTSWCVTHYEDMYSNYTHGGLGRFYFCLKRGFEDVKREKGEGSPLDEYGKSMFAISVNDDGSLNTCTCRWNHDFGGNDNLMNTKEISEFFGVNFYETFKPRSVDEIWAAYQEQGSNLHDRLTNNTGWIKRYADGYIEYVTRTEDRIVKYAFVWHNTEETIYCLASDHFVWFDYKGNEIQPPESASLTGDSSKFITIALDEWPELTSLKGLPKFTGPLILTSCKELSDVSAMLDVTEYTNNINIQNCKAISKEQVYDVVNRRKDIVAMVLDGAKEVNVANGFVSFKLPFTELEKFWHDSRDLVSFDTCNKIMQEGFIDYDYGGHFDADNVSSDSFDIIMQECGVDLSWSEISQIINGTVDDPEEELGITDEQYDRIREMIDDDFHDGMSIETINADCERNGAESEAQEGIMSAIQDKLPTYGTGKWDCYDGENIHLAIPFDAFVRGLHTLWTSEELFENCTLIGQHNGVINFLAAYLWDDKEDDIEYIEVNEPYYGWSGYDDEMWKEAITDFAYRVVKVITGVDPRDEKKKKNAE